MTETINIEVGTTLINAVTQEEDFLLKISNDGFRARIIHAGGDVSTVDMAYIRANYDLGGDVQIVESVNVEDDEEEY